MAESLAVLAGACTVMAILAATGTRPATPWLSALREREQAAAAALWGPRVDWRLPLVLQLGAGCAAGLTAGDLTGLPVLAAAGGVLGLALVRMAISVALRGRVRVRQDAVLESVRTLRGLLEAGGLGVQQSLSVLADRGPKPLREEFRALVAAGAAGRQADAWARARRRVADPLLDYRLPGLDGVEITSALRHACPGVAIVCLTAEVTAREAEALQVQARSAAAVIVLLPVAFLLILSALRSPYLDAYHRPGGAVFLAGALSAIGGSYLWMLHWLRLPAEPRLAVAE